MTWAILMAPIALMVFFLYYGYDPNQGPAEPAVVVPDSFIRIPYREHYPVACLQCHSGAFVTEYGREPSLNEPEEND